MAAATLFAIPFLALFVWRFVSRVLRRPLTKVVSAPKEQQRNVLLPPLRDSGQAGHATLSGSRFENCSDDGEPANRKDRVNIYLRRVVALTGATQMGNGYELVVGTTRFHVREKHVKRMRDVTDPECAFEETCFYPAYNQIPKSVQIATALLQLKNNPALFDRWAAQNGAFKADGQPFSRAV